MKITHKQFSKIIDKVNSKKATKKEIRAIRNFALSEIKDWEGFIGYCEVRLRQIK